MIHLLLFESGYTVYKEIVAIRHTETDETMKMLNVNRTGTKMNTVRKPYQATIRNSSSRSSMTNGSRSLRQILISSSSIYRVVQPVMNFDLETRPTVYRINIVTTLKNQIVQLNLLSLKGNLKRLQNYLRISLYFY